MLLLNLNQQVSNDCFPLCIVTFELYWFTLCMPRRLWTEPGLQSKYLFA